MEEPAFGARSARNIIAQLSYTGAMPGGPRGGDEDGEDKGSRQQEGTCAHAGHGDGTTGRELSGVSNALLTRCPASSSNHLSIPRSFNRLIQ